MVRRPGARDAVPHAAPATHYPLRLRVQDATCLVEVAETGTGLDRGYPNRHAAPHAVSGRGGALIAGLADQLEIRQQQPDRHPAALRQTPQPVPELARARR